MSSEAIKSAYHVEQDRRKSSVVVCECGDLEKEHGTITRACLKKKGGRFDGASDQVRCRCKQFVAASTEQSDPLVRDLLRSIVLAQGKKLTEQAAAIAKLQKDVSYLMGAIKI